MYDKTNNISSAMAALENVDECYLCEADLYISNPDIISKYQYSSNILGSFSIETDDWSYKLDNGYITDYKKVIRFVLIIMVYHIGIKMIVKITK